MSAPSRRPEIRRRRTRKEKIKKLQKRLAAAGSDQTAHELNPSSTAWVEPRLDSRWPKPNARRANSLIHSA